MNWMGAKGFDEAKYYKDEEDGISNQKPDSQIQENIQEAISRNELLDGLNIKVKVEEGRVTLFGKLKDQTLKSEVEKTVSQLSGVKGVLNLMA